jgi:hypothetical protein
MARARVSLGTRFAVSAAVFGLAVLLAACAAHFYETPSLAGHASHSIWSEADFVCALTSFTIASGVGLWSVRESQAVGALAAGSLSARVGIWTVLFVLLFGFWIQRVHLFTLLIAPSHAFAGLRLSALWTRWRSELRWQRR